MKLPKYKKSTRLDAQIKYKSMKQMYKALNLSQHPYLSLSRFSVKPRRKLCDFTGLPSSYTDPRTSLRFYDLSVYKYLQSLPADISEKFYYNKMYGNILFNNKK
ncbi:chromatin-remodeling complex subunit ies6 [Glugoides intestinalis]